MHFRETAIRTIVPGELAIRPVHLQPGVSRKRSFGLIQVDVSMLKECQCSYPLDYLQAHLQKRQWNVALCCNFVMLRTWIFIIAFQQVFPQLINIRLVPQRVGIYFRKQESKKTKTSQKTSGLNYVISRLKISGSLLTKKIPNLLLCAHESINSLNISIFNVNSHVFVIIRGAAFMCEHRSHNF